MAADFMEALGNVLRDVGFADYDIAEIRSRLTKAIGKPEIAGATPRTDAIYCPEFGMILRVDPAEGYEHACQLERELTAALTKLA